MIGRVDDLEWAERESHSQEFADCSYVLAAVHLLDTDILIDFLRGRGARALTEMNIIETEEPQEVYLGGIV